MKCINCGADLDEKAQYCFECGTKVEALKKRFCRECGAPLAGSGKFCSRCGAKTDIDTCVPYTYSQTNVEQPNSFTVRSNPATAKQVPKSDYEYKLDKANSPDKKDKNSKLLKKMWLIAFACVAVFLLIVLWPKTRNNNSSRVSDTMINETEELVTVKVVVNFTPNLIFSRYDVDFKIDNKTIKTLSHGIDATFDCQIEKGRHVVTFSNHGSSSVKGDSSLIVTCDLEVGYVIACYSDKVAVEVLYRDPSVVEAGKAKITGKASEFEGRDYKDVIDTLKSLGFTNIQESPVYDLPSGILTRGTVQEVLINGANDYNRGDVFEKDVIVVVRYHLLIEEDPNRQAVEAPTEKSSEASTESPTEGLTEPLTEAPTDPPTEAPTEAPTIKNAWTSHSSGDRAIAKQGNSGVFAYVKSGSYDVYYIIDFDAGYVYYFCHGNGDSSGDRVKIVRGNLNDYVLITYHDGGSVWSYGLHFKWANQPDTLIVQDQSGSEDKFVATNLDDALKIRDSLRMIDY